MSLPTLILNPGEGHAVPRQQQKMTYEQVQNRFESAFNTAERVGARASAKLQRVQTHVASNSATPPPPYLSWIVSAFNGWMEPFQQITTWWNNVKSTPQARVTPEDVAKVEILESYVLVLNCHIDTMAAKLGI